MSWPALREELGLFPGPRLPEQPEVTPQEHLVRRATHAGRRSGQAAQQRGSGDQQQAIARCNLALKLGAFGPGTRAKTR